MRICIVGGIYGANAAFRRTAQYTPETLLEDGLRSRGHSVRTVSHYEPIPPDHFDIVHVHHLSWGAVRAACHNSRARLVFTPHDPRAMSGALSPARQSASRFVMARADAVIPLSQTEATYQRRTYDLQQARQAVIPNGIDLELYRYASRTPVGQGPWKLLYVGQLNKLKSVDALLRAIALCPQNLELRLAFHVDTLRSDLEALAARLGLTSRIHFLGPQQPHGLAQLYQQAHVFALPSAGEALPSVVTEAMACGTPIVATRVGGIEEQLGGYGLLVSPGNVDELARALRRILENYPRYAAQGEAMSRCAQQRFSVEQMVSRHVHLYEELLCDDSLPRRRLASRSLSTAARFVIDAASVYRRKRTQVH